MEFVRYQHVERFGTDEVENIELGVCHVFPKIDGTNSSVWMNDGVLCAGSRNRTLSLEADNAGFLAEISKHDGVLKYLEKHPEHRIYGEWLVPHSLKTYRDDAWRKFYVFDVCIDTEDGGIEYLPYSAYVPMLEEFGIDYIPLLAEVRNGSHQQFVDLLEKNQFLVKDGQGAGEGIVIKNYSYKNRFGRTTWAKIVRSEFREIHSKTMGAPIVQGEKMVEHEIVDRFCTTAMIEKEYAKIVTESGGWSSKMIPRLFGQVWYSLISEDSWNIVKEFKNPKVNFKTLNALVIDKIKREKAGIF